MPGFMERFQQNNNQNQQSNSDNNQNNQNSDNNNQNDNNDDNNNNNNNNNVDDNTSIWDNTSSNKDNNDQNNNQQNQNNQQNNNQNQQTPDEIWKAHVNGLNLTDGVDLSDLQEQAQEGNFEAINTALETVSANTYKAALQQMNTIADTKIEAAIEKAVAESSSTINQSMAMTEMKSALPFTMDKDISPVAEAAMKQFMTKGASVQEAIEKVSAFFKATSEKVNGGDNQNNSTQSGFNPDGNINSGNNNNNNSGQEDSWMDFLTNKS